MRSCVAALLVLGGIALGREAMTLRLVAAGALVVLLFWPEALAGPSFQLSFAAVTAIVALHEHPRRARAGARGARRAVAAQAIAPGCCSLLLTGLAVEVALTPIALFHFHQAGLYGALANIVAIPLTTFVIMPLEALALLFDMAGLGAPFWWLAGLRCACCCGSRMSPQLRRARSRCLPAMPRGAFALMIAGGLWLPVADAVAALGPGAACGSARSGRWRRRAPDLLVTGDGRHVAMRTADGELALLRARAGDYVRDMLAEASRRRRRNSPHLEALPAAAAAAISAWPI